MDVGWLIILAAVAHSVVQADTAFISWTLIGLSAKESLVVICCISSFSTVLIYLAILWFHRRNRLAQILKKNWASALALKLAVLMGYWGIACLSFIPLMGFRKASLVVSAILELRFALIIVLFFHNLRLITEYVFGMNLVHYVVSVIRNILS